MYSVSLLKSRLCTYLVNGGEKPEQALEVEKLFMSVNLNLLLTHAQTVLTGRLVGKVLTGTDH